MFDKRTILIFILKRKEMNIITKEINYIKFKCNMCGKKYVAKYDNNQGFKNKERDLPSTWMHEFNIDIPSYPSKLDECEIQSFHLCDNCFIKLLKSFKIEPEIEDALGKVNLDNIKLEG